MILLVCLQKSFIQHTLYLTYKLYIVEISMDLHQLASHKLADQDQTGFHPHH